MKRIDPTNMLARGYSSNKHENFPTVKVFTDFMEKFEKDYFDIFNKFFDHTIQTKDPFRSSHCILDEFKSNQTDKDLSGMFALAPSSGYPVYNCTSKKMLKTGETIINFEIAVTGYDKDNDIIDISLQKDKNSDNTLLIVTGKVNGQKNEEEIKKKENDECVELEHVQTITNHSRLVKKDFDIRFVIKKQYDSNDMGNFTAEMKNGVLYINYIIKPISPPKEEEPIKLKINYKD